MIRPDLPHDHRLLTRIQGLLQSGSVTNDGAQVEGLERELAKALGVDDVVVVSSGSAALRIGVHALDLGVGSVVLPSFTYIATASAVVHAGLRPVFCDIDPGTWTLCPAALERVLSHHDDVRAVLSVTAYGVPADHDALAALAAAAGAEYIVDHAHGFGSERQSQRVPSPARFAAWSLHATKVLPAVEGGFVTSEDRDLLDRVRRLRRHGIDPNDPTLSVPGFNARMDEIRAAVGRASLRRAGRKLTQRRATYNRLRNSLSQIADGLYQVQRVPDGVHANGQNLALRWSGGAPLGTVIRSFARHGIEARRYFGPPLHHMHHFAQAADLEVTEDLAGRILCLPLYGTMATHEIERVEEAIAQVAAELSETGR
jgi:dTDP-4-amino-4,6-dideoxygalactose transaminase